MDKITHTETTTIDIYVAIDGTEFSNREECEKYEKELFEKFERIRIGKIAQRVNLEISGNEITESALLSLISKRSGYIYETKELCSAILALATEIRKQRHWL